MITAVVGIQWGDEGKGKIVDYLSQKADYVVRYHGGAGAGHTVVNKYGTVKLHQIPCGIFHPKTICVIANGVVVDPPGLLEEIAGLEKLGVKVKGRLLVSPRAHVVHHYHKVLDGIFDEAKGDFKTASTKRGNGPVHADKVSYYGIKLYDLLDKKTFHRKLSEVLKVKNRIIKEFGGEEFNHEKMATEYLNYGKKLRPYLADTFEVLNKAITQKKNVVFEGAHGIFLDVDWGTYPYVTASSIVPWNVGAGAGVDPRKLEEIIGVAKVYVTRVDMGACPMPTEMHGKEADFLREKAHEYGATTGRPRRIGWLDLVQLRFAARLCGLTSLAIIKTDILSGYKTVKACVGYRFKNKTVDYLDIDTEDLRKVKPVYKKFLGWDGDLSKIKSYEKLPKNLRRYLEFMEKFTGVPVKFISTGPRAEETIVRP